MQGGKDMVDEKGGLRAELRDGKDRRGHRKEKAQQGTGQVQ